MTVKKFYSRIKKKVQILKLMSRMCPEQLQDSQCAYKRDIALRSLNHFCPGKAIPIACSECVSVAFGILHAPFVRHIAVCGLSVFTVFFPHYLINGTIFEKKRVIEYKMCVLIF
jgi:hypothetical protein